MARIYYIGAADISALRTSPRMEIPLFRSNSNFPAPITFGEHFEIKLNLDFGAISKDVDERK